MTSNSDESIKNVLKLTKFMPMDAGLGWGSHSEEHSELFHSNIKEATGKVLYHLPLFAFKRVFYTEQCLSSVMLLSLKRFSTV